MGILKAGKRMATGWLRPGKFLPSGLEEHGGFRVQISQLDQAAVDGRVCHQRWRGGAADGQSINGEYA